MVRSLNSGISGIHQFQERMDVISNNIANVNTTGFKSGRVEFSDSFSETLRGSSGANGTVSGTPAIQIGTGVTTESIKNIYSQGSISRTGYQTDLAVSGDGFFIVRDPVTNTEFATRAGDFRLDANGYLTNNIGLHVQGFTDNGLSSRGDLVIDDGSRPAGSDPNATFKSFTINTEGVIKVQLSDNTEYTRGQVLLQRFSDPQALTKEGLNLYSGISAAGPLGGANSPTPQAPGTNGLGRIESGALEQSNVDLASEFTSMITTQRGFQANSRVITTTDEMLQDLVNLKR